MAIDGRIAAVVVHCPELCGTCNGSGGDPEDNWDDCPSCYGGTKDKPVVMLRLEPRERGGVAGQTWLRLLDPWTTVPRELSVLIGTEVCGGSSDLMVGKTKWADRVGYTGIRLVKEVTDVVDGSPCGVEVTE